MTVKPANALRAGIGDDYTDLRKLLKDLYPDANRKRIPEARRLIVVGSDPRRDQAIEILSQIRLVRIIPVVDRLAVQAATGQPHASCYRYR